MFFFAIKIVFVIEIVFVIYIVFAPVIGSMLSPWRGESAASSCLPKSELSETVTLFEIVFFLQFRLFFVIEIVLCRLSDPCGLPGEERVQ